MQAGSMQGYGSPEADDYLGAYVRSHALNEHISLIEETKKICHIPVIASINCYSDSEWVDFAIMMEKQEQMLWKLISYLYRQIRITLQAVSNNVI